MVKFGAKPSATSWCYGRSPSASMLFLWWIGVCTQSRLKQALFVQSLGAEIPLGWDQRYRAAPVCGCPLSMRYVVGADFTLRWSAQMASPHSAHRMQGSTICVRCSLPWIVVQYHCLLLPVTSSAPWYSSTRHRATPAGGGLALVLVRSRRGWHASCARGAARPARGSPPAARPTAD